MPASANSFATSPTRRMFSLRSCGEKVQIGAKAVADIVAVEDIGVFAHVEQLAFQFRGDGGFAGADSPVSQTTQPGWPLRRARCSAVTFPWLQ